MPTAVNGYDYPGYEELGNIFNISAAVSIPSDARIVATSGQIADNHDPLWGTHAEQFEKSMANIAKALASASPHITDPRQLWEGVFYVTSFHVGVLSREEQLQIAEIARECFGKNKPAWAAICVNALFPPEALVEVQVQAAYRDEKRA
jgi:enamine deaminase RidA (YjgF/YER057c/UK114 family)